MKKVILFFPDTGTLSDFLLDNSISNAIVNSRDCSLLTVLSKEMIDKAVYSYNGAIGRIITHQLTERRLAQYF